VIEGPSEFRPAVDAYQGPLDLLLYLIKKDEVDIFDIPIARVVDQYRAYLDLLQLVDPNSCGEFLVVAAQLMEIKSKLLLPREVLGEDGEALEDPRLELVQQLLEYKKYKERAMLLEKRFLEFRRRYDRPPFDVADESLDEGGPVDLGNVSVWDLLTAFHKIQLALGLRGPVRFVLRDRPVEEYIGLVEERLLQRPDRSARFEDLFLEAPNREEAIGIFLAILEMAKQYRLSLLQEEAFGPIAVRLRSEEEMLRLRALGEEEPATDPAEAYLLEGEGQEARGEPIAGAASEDLGPLAPDAEEPAPRDEP
jgi:segregation and condensation protein A